MFNTHKLNKKGFEEVKAFKSATADAVTRALAYLTEGREKALFKTKSEKPRSWYEDYCWQRWQTSQKS